MERVRNICLTINNYDDYDVGALFGLNTKYMILGFEIGSSGTEHIQGYIEFEEKISFSTLKKAIPTAHLEKRRGSSLEASEYCKKDGCFIETGERAKQGDRCDLANIKVEIENGLTVDDLAMDRPNIYHQYGRTLTKLEDIILRKKFRNWMTTCDWIYGPTGVGKSHRAFEGFNPATHYVWKDDRGWQDGYTGQGIIIINDFRGNIAYNDLLQLIDKYPYTIPRRNREPAPFLGKHVIITSSLHPRDIYTRRDNKDSLDQLLRRIQVIHLPFRIDGAQKWSGGNTNPLLTN